MHPFKSSGGIALAIAFALAAPFARGSLITPDSIPNPPQAVGSGGIFTPVPSGDLVTTQYTRLGLNFSSLANGSTTAITTINGVNVWTPAIQYTLPPFLGGGHVSEISPGGWAGGSFVVPGTLTPAKVSSVSLELLGSRGIVDFFNTSDRLLGTGKLSGIGPHGGFLYTFTNPDIQSFSIPAFTGEGGQAYPAWGPTGAVAQISFTSSSSPEPSSLVLAALGALGLAGRFFAQRRM
jgi:hypothetical protein